VNPPRRLDREPELAARDLDGVTWRWVERAFPGTASDGWRFQAPWFVAAALGLFLGFQALGPTLCAGGDWRALAVVLAVGAVAAVPMVAWVAIRVRQPRYPRSLRVDRRGLTLDGAHTGWDAVRAIERDADEIRVVRFDGEVVRLGHPLRASHLAAFADAIAPVLAARRGPVDLEALRGLHALRNRAPDSR
jgi:hypothetical protein